ncbi:MAG: LysR family transcriptional regulator [Rhodoferax sp.]
MTIIDSVMRRRLPSLQALAAFEATARHGSTTRAAQELALTQSAVSRQVNALEAFVGLALFRRTRHGLVLTDAGRAYAQSVTQRLSALEQDTLDVMSTQGSARVLHLASVPTFAARWLIPRLSALRAAQPALTLHIDTRTRPFLFADTPFDAALFAATPAQISQWAGTQAVKLLDEVVVPVAAPALLLALLPQGAGDATAPLTPQQVAQLPLLQQSTRAEAWRAWFDAQGVAAPNALGGPRFEQFSMTAAAAVHGLGAALIPRLLIEQELSRGELVVLCPRPLASARAYYLVRPEGAAPPAALLAFQDWLAQAAQMAQATAEVASPAAV